MISEQKRAAARIQTGNNSIRTTQFAFNDGWNTAMQAVTAELAAIIDLIPKEYVVQCCEGGGPENPLGTLAISIKKMSDSQAIDTLGPEIIRKTDLWLAEKKRADTLQRFKDWVHNWLDAHAVPADPYPEKTKETGCRIGGRLRWLLKTQFYVLAGDHAEWSQRVFGKDSDRGPVGPLNHLKRECNEALTNPNDPLEYADLLLLVMDAARRAGFDANTLLNAARQKLEINKTRKWGTEQPDGVFEHKKEE